MSSRIVAKITVTEAEASCAQNTILTSGMEGTAVEFSFSEEWEGLAKTVVFVAGTLTKQVILNEDNMCLIPSEVLVTARIPLVVGVYGTDGTTVVIPTIYTSLGLIAVGTAIPSDTEIGVTQSLYDQIVALEVALGAEVNDIKESEVKEVGIDATEAGKVGTASVSLQTTWIDDEDHSQGKKATFIFKNLKGNGITSVKFNDSNNIVITLTDGSTTTFNGVATAISTMSNLETSVEKAESSRASAEESRVSAESSRASAESSRASAENTRVSSEEKRTNAESNRASAESARSTAESNRASAENTRVSSENTRVSNESERVKAENARASAETSRASAESSRSSAESNRVSAENARVSAENSRASAESSRENNEKTRTNNETTRTSNETTRTTNETSRVKAESARASAENTRETNENSRIANEIKKVNVTVNNSVGTPSATVTKSGNVLGIDFINLKGNQGDKGDTGDCCYPEFSVNPATGRLSVSGADQASLSYTVNNNGHLEVELL